MHVEFISNYLISNLYSSFISPLSSIHLLYSINGYVTTFGFDPEAESDHV